MTLPSSGSLSLKSAAGSTRCISCEVDGNETGNKSLVTLSDTADVGLPLPVAITDFYGYGPYITFNPDSDTYSSLAKTGIYESVDSNVKSVDITSSIIESTVFISNISFSSDASGYIIGITFDISENTSGNDRVNTIKLISNNNSNIYDTFTFTQAEEHTLNIVPGSIQLDESTAYVDLTIPVDADDLTTSHYILTTGASSMIQNLELQVYEGTYGYYLHIIYDITENQGAYRTGTITITHNLIKNLKDSILIKQTKETTGDLFPPNQTVSAGWGTVTTDITTTDAWKFNISEEIGESFVTNISDTAGPTAASSLTCSIDYEEVYNGDATTFFALEVKNSFGTYIHVATYYLKEDL